MFFSVLKQIPIAVYIWSLSLFCYSTKNFLRTWHFVCLPMSFLTMTFLPYLILIDTWRSRDIHYKYIQSQICRHKSSLNSDSYGILRFYIITFLVGPMVSHRIEPCSDHWYFSVWGERSAVPCAKLTSIHWPQPNPTRPPSTWSPSHIEKGET